MHLPRGHQASRFREAHVVQALFLYGPRHQSQPQTRRVARHPRWNVLVELWQDTPCQDFASNLVDVTTSALCVGAASELYVLKLIEVHAVPKLLHLTLLLRGVSSEVHLLLNDGSCSSETPVTRKYYQVSRPSDVSLTRIQDTNQGSERYVENTDR